MRSRFAKWPIQIKIAILFSLGLVTIAIAVGAPIFFTANNLFASEAEAALVHQNEIVANELDLLTSKAASDLLLARQNEAFDRLYLTGDQSALDAVQNQILYLQNRFAIDEICVITGDGKEIARCAQGKLAGIDELSPDETSAPFFAPTLALADGEVYRSPVPYISVDTHRWVVAHATPLVLPDGTKVGIFHFEIPLAWFAAKVDTNGLAGSYSFLMTKDGQMLVHPNIDDMRKASGIDPSNPDQADFPSAKVWASDDFRLLIERMKSERTGSGTYRDGSETYEVIYRPAFNNLWIVATVRQQSVVNQRASYLLRQTLFIIVPLLLIVVGIILWYNTRLVAPITRLTKAAQQAIAGDLSGQVPVESTDEIGILAATFNSMTAQLQQTLAGLEERVAERTADLNTSRIQSEEHARDLQSINEISQIILSEQKLEILLPLITRLVSEKFNFYHTGIFLVDDSRKFVVLQASNSEGGQRMLYRGHRLEIGTGIVGTVASTGKSRIALDVGGDAVFFNNLDLPGTRSEMALPLIVRGETIGVLDVQSMNSSEFTESDAKTIGVLAGQIAIAIENARLFTKTRQALDELQMLYNQYLKKEWKVFRTNAGTVGYQQSLAGGKPLESLIESDDIRKVLQSGDTLVVHEDETHPEPTVVVPIKLRGQTIGVLNINAPVTDHQWSNEEVKLIQSVSDRLALALENARLFEETNRRAERERLVSDISGKIRMLTDPQAMIQTAMEELRIALGASRVQIIPQSLNEKE